METKMRENSPLPHASTAALTLGAIGVVYGDMPIARLRSTSVL
ncbi:hypothetical protein [Novosphingobium pentaromativorans]|uniref:Potassium transporter n=1 Tax=Novosphingobium pentaromativorans US6-1 TaxID=1088721 RepID=G6EKM4_9SPHN|nr:hypothetical protein [Novosphingobium pentaromativorans]EHJ58145.1 potassium transporter [Novosphingobium pentaromativorans US6-1]